MGCECGAGLFNLAGLSKPEQVFTGYVASQIKTNNYFVMTLLIHLHQFTLIDCNTTRWGFPEVWGFHRGESPMLEPERVPEVNQTKTVRVGPHRWRISTRPCETTSKIEAVRRMNASERTLKTLWLFCQSVCLSVRPGAGQRAAARRIKPAVFLWKTVTSGVLMTLTKLQPLHLFFLVLVIEGRPQTESDLNVLARFRLSGEELLT